MGGGGGVQGPTLVAPGGDLEEHGSPGFEFCVCLFFLGGGESMQVIIYTVVRHCLSGRRCNLSRRAAGGGGGGGQILGQYPQNGRSHTQSRRVGVYLVL